MATNKTNLSTVRFYEAYGVIVGLFGDPANQNTDNYGTDINSAFASINGSIRISGVIDKPSAVLVWSRLLLVRLLIPYDVGNSMSSLVLVARPRSLWLYAYSGTQVADFVGNYADAYTIGTPDSNEIVEVNPPYRYGDVIRLSMLPAPITISNFSDNFDRSSFPETYDGSQTRNPLLSNVSLSVNGNSVTDIAYYDRNVDARTRIVGAADTGNQTVTIPLCIGGVTSVYELKGVRRG